jgi:hypothetical protein
MPGVLRGCLKFLFSGDRDAFAASSAKTGFLATAGEYLGTDEASQQAPTAFSIAFGGVG